MARVSLEIDQDVLARARQRAAEQSTTVEAMVEDFLRVLGEPRLRKEDLPPITRSVLGIWKGLPDRPDDELLGEALEEKYGSGK